MRRNGRDLRQSRSATETAQAGRSRFDNGVRAQRHASRKWWETEPDVGRVADGVPNRVERLRCIGNAVVPQQAYPIFKAIAEAEGEEIC